MALKDLTRSFRSMFAVGMMVVAPLMLTGLIYFAFGGMSSKTPTMPAVQVGIVNLDTLPANSALDAPLGQSVRDMFFDDSVKTWITASDYANEASARAAVDKQQVGVAVIVPPEFTARLLGGEVDVQVLILSDPTLTIGPTVVQNMVTALLDGVQGGGIALDTIVSRQRANGITPDPAAIPNWIAAYQAWYTELQRNLFHQPDQAALRMVAPAAGETGASNPLQETIGLVMAGQMIFFAFFTGAYSMMSILREDEEGTLARLFTTPTGRTTILAGKFLAVFLTVLLQGIVLILASRLAFGVRWGNPMAAALALAGQVVAAAGLGVLIIAFLKNSRQAGPVLSGALCALGFLGGLMTVAVPNMPAAFTTIANFTPQGWVLKGWRMVLNGQTLAELLVPFVVLVAMGVLMFAVGALRFRRRFA